MSKRKPEPLLSYTGSTITNDTLSKQAKTFFKKLREVNHSNRPPPFILALDEAHVLTTRGRGYATSLEIFTKIPLIGLLKFISPLFSYQRTLKGQIGSERSHSARLAGVLTCVPFDIFVVHKKVWTVAEISTLQFISTFGRPL